MMKATKKDNSNLQENILYELLLYTEWDQESDLARSTYKFRDKSSSFIYSFIKPWDYFRKNETFIDVLANFQSTLLDWNLAIGEGGVVGVVRDTILEIRPSRDNYSSVVGKATVVKDGYPEWRRLCWSPDSCVFALSTSCGAVTFYDLLGDILFTIPSNCGNVTNESQVWMPENKLAGLLLITARVKNPKWPYELILVDCGGGLLSYNVSTSENYMEFHRYSLNKSGVSAICWCPTHNLLIVASQPEHPQLTGEPLGWGLSAYRILNDHPYYRLAVPSPEDVAQAEATRGLRAWLSSLFTQHSFSLVFKMVVSPDSRHLACLHTCGTVSIWQLPSLRCHRVWNLKDQPNYDLDPKNGMKRSKASVTDDFFPADISWWAEQKLMIARRNGVVSVCDINELRNLLGEVPEVVKGVPRLTPINTSKGVLVLDCENTGNQNDESDEEEQESLVNKSTKLVKSTIYLLTDIERFQPKRKKAKIQKHHYRLLGVKSTTPEELFSRKIEWGDFTEALSLAETYNLDTDRVYQSQWRKGPVTEETISLYLSKISKKRWVFEECYERIPDSLSAAKKLIEFGLKITTLSAFLELSSEGDAEVYEDSIEDDVVLQSKTIKEVLTTPINGLSEEQKSLVLSRRTLLRYSDRLFTYEKMINSSEEAYDRELYDKFRRQPIQLSAVELAKKSDYKAVGLLFTYQGNATLPYWLNTLSSFPETTNPANYQHLLPECSAQEDIFPWDQAEIRTEDWSENEHFDVLEGEEDVSEYSLPQRDEVLTPASLEEWYHNRIYQLEQMSNLVDQPLELVKLARERNIKGLDGLYNELVTLDVLVHDLGMEDLSLRDLENMSPIQKAQALMSQSNEGNFVENLRHRLVPFLQRCEKLQKLSRQQLLFQFLSEISANDLACPLKMFEFCSAEPLNSIVQNTEEMITLALESIYAYRPTDQLDKVEAILNTLPSSSLGSSASSLIDKVDGARNELNVAYILRKRGRDMSMFELHNSRNNTDVARAIFLDLSTSTSSKVPAASESEWNQLLEDFIQMQDLVFDCLPLELCYEVHTAGVLGSGVAAVVRTAAQSLCCYAQEQHRKPLTLQRSVALVLHAATQYFDAAASLTDPTIKLAQTCLNLITEDNKEIQEEQDLIAGLELLNEFKISLLPMQVRLCTDRMRLVESCLTSRASAYKDYHKLLSLAHKLRICGNDSRQREGIILVRVANISFQARDYRHCAEICTQLMDRQHSVGWEVTQQLGQCGEYWDLSVRRQLIAFSLIHCPDDKLQELMDTRCELEYQKLQMFIHEQTNKGETPTEDEEFVDAVTSPQTPVKEFLPQLSSTLQNTSKLLTQLTNSGFWKDRLLNKEAVRESVRKGDSKMALQGFHEFYHSLHNRCHASVLSSQYSRETVDWAQYQLIQALLQASLLQQEKLPQHLLRDIDHVLVQYSSLLMPEDSCLGLAALLTLAKPELSEQCFSSLPLTLITLQLAVYLLALMLALQHNQLAFFWTPDQVVSWATSHGDGTSKVTQLLNKALVQLGNYDHSKNVERLGCGVDVRRFAWDAQYKTDSILGLAMCEEREKLQAALELGTQHDVAGWEIVFSHLRTLLVNNSPALSERLADNRLVQLLQEQPQAVVTRLEESVLPTLNGQNHNQLINYFTVLATVAPNISTCGLLPRDHIKLIKKVKATSSEIDYARIVSRPAEVMEALRPAVRKDSVSAIAKLVKELLKALPSLQTHISVSNLYLESAVAQFRLECLSPSCRDPVEQFTSLQTHMQKMTGPDLLTLVKKTVFCHQSVIKLDPDIREDMVDSLLRICNQHHHLNDDSNLLKIKQLKDYIQQLWTLYNPSLKNLKSYLIRLDEACGDTEAISTIMQTALLDASIPSQVLQKIAKLFGKKTLSGYVTDVLHSMPSHPGMVTVALQRVEDCLNHGEKFDSWSILVGPLLEKPELPVSVRKHAAQISQRLGSNYGEELEALRLKTEAVLRTPVQLSQVQDQNARYLLFKQLLSEADTWDQLFTLSLLLSSWPDVDSSWYLDLMEIMAEIPDKETFSTLQRLFKKHSFEEEEVSHLISRTEGVDALFTISVCLISNFKSLYFKAVDLLNKLPYETPLTKEVASRIVETELTPKLVGSPIFDKLRQVLLESSTELCEKASDQLSLSNHRQEAEEFLPTTLS